MIDAFIRERSELLAEYVIETGATVRATAAHFGVSKSTVHKDLTYKLKYLNPGLYVSVKEILEKNKSERHIRGGEATRKKYLIKNRESCGGNSRVKQEFFSQKFPANHVTDQVHDKAGNRRRNEKPVL